MKVYIDTSVVLRVLFAEPTALSSWGEWEEAFSSRLWHTEALRVLERVRMEGRCESTQFVCLRKNIEVINDHFAIVPLSEAILARAGESFPTMIGTLDAIHLASALYVRDSAGLDAFLTHDKQLGMAASAMGFHVIGL